MNFLTVSSDDCAVTYNINVAGTDGVPSVDLMHELKCGLTRLDRPTRWRDVTTMHHLHISVFQSDGRHYVTHYCSLSTVRRAIKSLFTQ